MEKRVNKRDIAIGKKAQQDFENSIRELKGGFSSKIMCTYVLGTTEVLFPVIDKIYNENPTEYHRCYLKGKVKNDEWRKTFNVEEEGYIIKASGIIEKAYEDKDLSVVLSLIQKGYKMIYNQFKQTDFKIVNAMEIAHKMNKNGKEQVSEVVFSKSMMVVGYLCDTFDTTVLNKEVVETAIEIYFSNIVSSVTMQSRFYSEGIINIKRMEKLFEEVTGGLKLSDKNIGGNVEQFISSLHITYATREQEKITKELKTKISLGLINLSEMTLDISELALDRMENFITVRCAKGFKMFQKLFKGNVYSTLKSAPLNKKTMIIILQNLDMALQNKIVLDEEKEMYFIASLYNYALFHNYNNLKEELFEHIKEDIYNLEEKHMEEIDFKQTTIDMLTCGNKKLKSDKENLIKELREKELENKRLQKELNKRNKDREELLRLREMLKQQSKEVAITVSETSFEEKVEFLKGRKLALFGGSEGWFEKFEQVGVDCYGMEVGNIDLSFVKNLDKVFVYSKYCDHKLVKKLRSEMKSCDTDLVFLNQTNIELCVDVIYNSLV